MTIKKSDVHCGHRIFYQPAEPLKCLGEQHCGKAELFHTTTTELVTGYSDSLVA